MILLLAVFCSSDNNALLPPNPSVLRYDDNASTARTSLPKRRLAAALKASQTLPDQEAFLNVIDGLEDSPSSFLASSFKAQLQRIS